MTYNGQERRDTSVPEDIKLKHDVVKIAERVLKEGVPIEQIDLREAGIAREKLIEAVRDGVRAILKKSPIGTSDKRKRIHVLFGISSEQPTPQNLPPRKSSRPKIPQLSRRPTPRPGPRASTPRSLHISTLRPGPPDSTLQFVEIEGKIPQTKMEFETRLFEYGELYLPPKVSFEELKEAVLSRFIIACTDLSQQMEVTEIVQNLTTEDIDYKGRRDKYHLFSLTPNVLEKLKTASMLTQEDRSSNKREVYEGGELDFGIKVD